MVTYCDNTCPAEEAAPAHDPKTAGHVSVCFQFVIQILLLVSALWLAAHSDTTFCCLLLCFSTCWYSSHSVFLNANRMLQKSQSVVISIISSCYCFSSCSSCACSATWPQVAGPIKPEVDVFFRQYLLFILGAIHLIFSLWMVVEYFLVNYPNFILPLPSFFYTLFGRSVLH